MTDFTDMLSKAKKMQERMKEVQKTLENIEVEGTAGGDLVKVVLRGDYEMKSILVTEKAKNEKREIINDYRSLLKNCRFLTFCSLRDAEILGCSRL